MSGSSGTSTFQLTNTTIIMEAFERIKVDPQVLTPRMLLSARTSLNIELATWSNKGFNYWRLDSGQVQLAVGQATYPMPADLVTLTELWYSQVNAEGPNVNQDRWMVPMTREQYAQMTNKNQQGIPTQYWFQMLIPPQITIWQTPQPDQVSPQYVMNWYGLKQIEDANLGGLETPNIPYRAMDALCSGLAVRLATKFGPGGGEGLAMKQDLRADFDMAWADMGRRDNEPGDVGIRPQLGSYGRM